MNHAPPTLASQLTTQWTRQVSRALAGPLAVLILIPVMVCGVGLVISLSSWHSHKASVERLATERFGDQAALAAGAIEDALAQGDAVLAVLRDFVAWRGLDFDIEDYAHLAAGQMEGRDILAFVGIGDHRGHYTGVYIEDSKASESRKVLSERRMQENGRSHLREYYITETGLDLTQKGELIAQPGLRQEAKQYQEGRGDVPRLEEAGHPMVQACLARAGMGPAPGMPVPFEYEDERFLAVSLHKQKSPKTAPPSVSGAADATMHL